MFNLVEITVSGPVICLDDEGKPLEYATGPEAAEAAKTLSTSKGVKVQPRRASNDAWKLREAARFDNGTYTPLPWANEDWFLQGNVTDHFAHLSTEGKAMVAYTADADKGVADLQTRVKAGKYLQQFYGHVLDAPTIARLATEFAEMFESNELQFAEDADEIEHVYVNGPRSCMSYDPDSYSGPEHPTRVYASGDLAVAYIERDGEITARAVVWPSEKIHARIYGDEVRLGNLLEKAGYIEGTLRGAKLRRIPYKGRFVVPYVDCCHRAEDDGTHLIIGRGDIGLRRTCGLSDMLMRCCHCDDGMREDNSYYCDDDGEHYCGDCASSQLTYCDRTDRRVLTENCTQVHIRNYRGNIVERPWSQRAVENDAFQCPVTEEYYENDLGVEMSGSAEGDTWSYVAFETGGFVCEGNGLNYPIADLVTLDDRTAWSQEHFDDNGKEVDGIFYRADDAPLDAKNYHCKDDCRDAFELEQPKPADWKGPWYRSEYEEQRELDRKRDLMIGDINDMLRRVA